MHRIEALNKLPVFMDVRGKHVLLVGQGNALLWKAELMSAAGAQLRLITPEPCEDLEAFAKEQQDSTTLTVGRMWRVEDFKDCHLTIADMDDDQAKSFRAAAHKAGLLVNIIDNPRYCDFQFGSIVNRSPLVIGISTDGAAPILGQAIRRRIEALLPRSLSVSLKTAQIIRQHIKDTLDTLSRRSFWEQFSKAAFEQTETGVTETLAIEIRKTSANPQTTGKVTLVGAGPGDPELLTMKAVRTLQSADIVLYDYLIGEEILDYARREAKRLLVGKRAGHHSHAQEEIHSLMIKLARQGKHVVRLKGGDPMVFGRGGEEIQALKAAGIPYAVVPGITAALGAASSLSLPLTHRDHAHRLQFITGQGKNHRGPELEWAKIADEKATTLVYMGLKNAPFVVERLLSHGMSPKTPVIAIGDATRKTEWSLSTSLEALPVDLQNCETSSPVLLMIGQNCTTALQTDVSVES